MMNGSGGGGPGGERDDEDPGNGLLGAGAAEALAQAEDSDLVALASLVMAELKDRGLLRVMLRNRTDFATVFETDALRETGDGIDVVAAGYHAETPDDYAGWVAESAILRDSLERPGLAEPEAEELVSAASDEALLLTLDSTRPGQEEDEEDAGDGGIRLPDDSDGSAVATRVAMELLRRGVIEAQDE